MEKPIKQQRLQTVIWPILVFFILLIFGLFAYPKFSGNGMLPLEVLILMSISFSCLYLFRLGYSWKKIEEHITKKVGESIPVVLILFAIGVLIGSWIISGTIPMLIYHGIDLVSPRWIYLFAFIICIIFSLLTGTSWGSAGTIGIVMMSISEVYEANLAITAGAVVGGSFFGDKMSPLSDTTNIAALATGVNVIDHIKSMFYTTGPSAIIAGCLYFVCCFNIDPSSAGVGELPAIALTLSELDQIFNFNLLLLLPLAVVIWGSITRKPIFLTLLGSAWIAMILAFIFQPFSTEMIFESFKSGFNQNLLTESFEAKSNVINILNRGGLYNLIDGIVISLLIFAYIGTLDVIKAIDISLQSIMTKIKKQSSAVAAALTATLFTNMMVSNQYATSFLVGSAFQKKFDKMKIPRKVLSRSLEDAGTMMENLVPWTPSGVFMAGTLGIGVFEYVPYQFLSLVNIVVAYLFALTGWFCFFGNTSEGESEKEA